MPKGAGGGKLQSIASPTARVWWAPQRAWEFPHGAGLPIHPPCRNEPAAHGAKREAQSGQERWLVGTCILGSLRGSWGVRGGVWGEGSTRQRARPAGRLPDGRGRASASGARWRWGSKRRSACRAGNPKVPGSFAARRDCASARDGATPLCCWGEPHACQPLSADTAQPHRCVGERARLLRKAMAASMPGRA
jgi:hypothetical protein